MEKKRSVGVTIFGIFALLFSFAYIIEIYVSRLLQARLCLIMGISFLISGIFLFSLRNWACILFLFATGAQSVIYIIFNFNNQSMTIFERIPGFLIATSPFLISLFFFTRPKVREQFK